jgi:uncharacterized protein (TIGR02266 family)
VEVKASTSGGEDTTQLIPEFVALNRRRTRGDPPLDVRELERWMELRALLEKTLSPQPDGQEARRRKALRVPTHLKVRCSNASSDQLSVANEISEGGLFLATENPLAPGTPLHLDLEGLDEGSPLEVEGVVIWVRDQGGDDSPAGMGIRFTNLDEVQRQAVEYLVEHALTSL